MADEAEQPDWSLLPHRPVEFFGLADGFDLTELKRSYNRLIRRFKPERSPAEFQRIREAYEQLERMLRYGYRPPVRPAHVPPVIPQPPVATDPGKTPVKPERGPEPERVEKSVDPTGSYVIETEGSRWESGPWPPRSYAERVETESPDELIAEIESRPQRTPADYVALAILRDAVNPDDRSVFLSTLLEGLRHWPGDYALIQLVSGHFAGIPVGEDLFRDLQAAANALRGPQFYPVTEDAWKRITVEVEFPRFQTLLASCEASLRAGESPQRLIFLAAILPCAAWRADPEWVAMSLARFDARVIAELPILVDQLETFETLWQYIRDPRRRADHSRPRQRFDALVRTFSEKPDDEACSAFLRFQVEAVRDTPAWLEAFPVRSGSEHAEALALYRQYESQLGGHCLDGFAGRDNWFSDAQRLNAALQLLSRGPGSFSLRHIVWEVFAWCHAVSTGIVNGCLFLTYLSVSFPSVIWLSLTLKIDNMTIPFVVVFLGGIFLFVKDFYMTSLHRMVKGRLAAIESALAWSIYRTRYRHEFLSLFEKLGWGHTTSAFLIARSLENVTPVVQRMAEMWCGDLSGAVILTAERYQAT